VITYVHPEHDIADYMLYTLNSSNTEPSTNQPTPTFNTNSPTMKKTTHFGSQLTHVSFDSPVLPDTHNRLPTPYVLVSACCSLLAMLVLRYCFDMLHQQKMLMSFILETVSSRLLNSCRVCF